MRQLVTLLLATGLAQQGQSSFSFRETAVMTEVPVCSFASIEYWADIMCVLCP